MQKTLYTYFSCVEKFNYSFNRLTMELFPAAPTWGAE